MTSTFELIIADNSWLIVNPVFPTSLILLFFTLPKCGQQTRYES